MTMTRGSGPATAFVLAVLIGSGGASAAESDVANGAAALIYDRWYGALEAADREEIAALLAPDATITLTDLGITQSRDEFVDSMDEWSDAIAGGSIRHRVVSADDTGAQATVCYTFTGNEMMTDERFTVRDGQIETSVQTTLADHCDGF